MLKRPVPEIKCENNRVEFNKPLYTVTHSTFRNNHICFILKI